MYSPNDVREYIEQLKKASIQAVRTGDFGRVAELARGAETLREWLDKVPDLPLDPATLLRSETQGPPADSVLERWRRARAYFGSGSFWRRSFGWVILVLYVALISLYGLVISEPYWSSEVATAVAVVFRGAKLPLAVGSATPRPTFTTSATATIAGTATTLVRTATPMGSVTIHLTPSTLTAVVSPPATGTMFAAETATVMPGFTSVPPMSTDTPVPPPSRDTPEEPMPMPTDTPVLAPLSLAFPGLGQTFPVMPWQVVVTHTQPVSVTIVLQPVAPLTEPVTLTWGDGTVVMPSTSGLVLVEDSPLQRVGDAYAYTWRRGIDDLKELPDGAYSLTALSAAGSADQPPLRWESFFRIEKGQGSRVSVSAFVRIRANPTEETTSTDTIIGGEQGIALGRFTYRLQQDGTVPKNKDGYEADWCLFERQDGQRSWTWCRFLRPDKGAPSQEALPLLAPEFPVEKYP